MKTSVVIPEDAKTQFWEVVRECLRVFHKSRPHTRSAFSRLKKKIGQLPREEMELFYHSEPFHVACRVAGRELDVKDYLDRYITIRDDIYNSPQKEK